MDADVHVDVDVDVDAMGSSLDEKYTHERVTLADKVSKREGDGVLEREGKKHGKRGQWQRDLPKI